MKSTASDSRAQLFGLICLGFVGCMEGPNNGQTFSGPNVGRIVPVRGRVPTASTPITIQILSSPTANPDNDADWITIGTTVSSATGTSWNDPNPFYSWTLDVVPVSTAAEATRWPQGGLARMRATMPGSTGTFVLTTFDDDMMSCFLARFTESWLSIGRKCASPYGQQPLIVSTTPSPADAVTAPGYLTRPIGTANSAAAYYATINAPSTLAAFRSTFGFGELITFGHLDNDETSAVYFNRDDLGLGREMHCKTYAFPFGDSGEACYVTNYAPKDPTGHPIFDEVASALAAAVTGDSTKVIATVAMVYSNFNAANRVQFMVYGPNGAIQNTAQLDSRGVNTAVPNNCMSCHGGTGGYDAVTHSVADAFFLPFDPGAFEFSTTPEFTKAAQQEKFRRLNFMVLNTRPTPGIVGLLSTMYLPLTPSTPGATVDESAVPVAWQTSPVSKKLYDNVVRHYCRTCHISQLGYTDWSTFLGFKSDPNMQFACNAGASTMPHAETTSRRYWNSPARAHLVNALNLRLGCTP